MNSEIDDVIRRLRDSRQRLSSEDRPALAAKLTEYVNELTTLATAELGPVRRYGVLFGYVGHDWLGEPCRSDSILNSISFQFLSRERDSLKLAQEARNHMYRFVPILQGDFERDWKVLQIVHSDG